MEIASQKNLESFFSGLIATLDSVNEVQKIYNPIMAFEFNPFKRFWLLDENKVSDIITFFLNPDETHGQGNLFLKIFLKKLELNEPLALLESGCSVSAQTKYKTDNNREIDFVIIFGKNEFIVGVENKIHLQTQDQWRQVSDYCSFLLKKNNNKSVLFYLAPEGKNPSEVSISKEERLFHESNKHLRIISYENEIIEIVDQWYVNSRAERIRSFLIEFYNYLNQKYMGKESVNNEQIISDYIMKSFENVETAFEVGRTLNLVKQKIIEKFINSLKSEIGNKWEIALHGDYSKKNTEVWFSHKSWKEHAVVFAFFKDYEELYIGIYRKDNEDAPENELKKQVRSILNNCNIGTNENWKNYLWLCYFDTYDNTSWTEVLEGKFSIKIKETLDEIEQKLKSLKL